MEAAGGYSIDHKIAEILHGLGFTDAVQDQGERAFGRAEGAAYAGEAPARKPGRASARRTDQPPRHRGRPALNFENFSSSATTGISTTLCRESSTGDGRLIDYPNSDISRTAGRAATAHLMLRAYENQQQQLPAGRAYIRKYKAGRRAPE